MKLGGRSFCFFAFILMLSCFRTLFLFAEEVGVVTFLKGEATVFRGIASTDLALDTPIFRDDKISTKEKSKLRIVFFANDLKGSKVIGPESFFDVSKFASEKANSHTIQNIAVDLFQTFAKPASSTVHTSATRNVPSSVICYPRGTHIGPINKIILLPEDLVTNYKISITYEDPALEKKPFEVKKPIFDCPITIKPGIGYLLEVEIFEESGHKEMVKTTFSIASDAKSLEIITELEKIQNEFNEEDDPTVYLAKGNFLLQQGCWSDSFLEFLKYAKLSSQSELVKEKILTALDKTNFKLGISSEEEETKPTILIEPLVKEFSFKP